MRITLQQNKELHLHLNKSGLSASKKDLVFGFTEGRSESSKDLLMHEATALIHYLKSQNKEGESAQQMRRKIIAMAHNLRWEQEGGAINMDTVNHWCLTKSYLKKELNSYTYSELPKLVSQFTAMYRSLLNKI